MSALFQRFHHSIDCLGETMAAITIYFLASEISGGQCVFGDLRGSQTAESRNTVIELRPVIYGNVIPDFRSLNAELVNSFREMVCQFVRSGAFSPRSKTAHEASKMFLPFISRIVERIFPRPAITGGRELMIGPPTEPGPQTSPNSSDKENLGRIKLDAGHLLIWGAVSAVISFLIGVGANSISRALESPYRSWPNTNKSGLRPTVEVYNECIKRGAYTGQPIIPVGSEE